MVHAAPRYRVHTIRGHRDLRNGVSLPFRSRSIHAGEHRFLHQPDRQAAVERKARVRGQLQSRRSARIHCSAETDGIKTEKVEEFDYGRFAWVRDPDNNRIELYEPLARMGG